MLLSALSKVLSTLLVMTIVGATLMMVFSQTVLNSHYLEGKLDATNSYERLSTALTDQISKQATKEAGNAEKQQFAAKLAPLITPQLLRSKIDSGLDQMQAYYRGNGPLPVIDLTDIATQAQAAGIPIPEDSGINKPIPLGVSERGKSYSHTFDNMRQGTIMSIVVLTAALLTVCWQRRKWVALPDVLIAVGVLLGLLVLIFTATSSGLAHSIKFDTDSNAFSVLGRDLASAMAKDLAGRLGVIAAVFGVVGIGARILVGRIGSSGPATPVPKARPKQALKLIS
jgi:hypothetical protein